MLGVSADDKHLRQRRRFKVVVGRRLRHRAGVPHVGVHRRLAHKRARAAPSLASEVGGGMAAGTAFAHPRAADARVRPIFLRPM